jgi:hypothetical protein
MHNKPVGDEASVFSDRIAKNRTGLGLQSPETAQTFMAQMRNLNAGWRADLAEMQKRETDFACRLARSVTPSDAMQVCTEWMSSRVGSVSDTQAQFLALWARYAGSLPPGTAPEMNPLQPISPGKEIAPVQGADGS